MITQTSELAIRSLIALALEGGTAPIPPRKLAKRLDCSPSYLAKVLGALVRAGVLSSSKGAYGGVRLVRKPVEITVLEVVESCQGLLIGNYCQKIGGLGYAPCGFHQAMEELYSAVVTVLSGWTVADLLEKPYTEDMLNGIPCRMMIHPVETPEAEDRPTGEEE